MVLAAVRGLRSVEHGVLLDGDFDRLSAWAFSDWFEYHGISRATRTGGWLLAAVYDIAFGFRDGRPDQPVMEAGTALRSAIRILLGHARAPACLLRTGAGETLQRRLFAAARGDRSGGGEAPFGNVYLAGDWTKNRVDGGSVEGAVTSGIEAARCIAAASHRSESRVSPQSQRSPGSTRPMAK